MTKTSTEFVVRTNTVNVPEWQGKIAINVFRNGERIGTPVLMSKGWHARAIAMAGSLAKKHKCNVTVAFKDIHRSDSLTVDPAGNLDSVAF